MRELMLQLHHVLPSVLEKLIALGLDRIELGSSPLWLHGNTLADACALVDCATSKRLRNGWSAVFESTCDGVTVATTASQTCANYGACMHDGVAHIGTRPYALTHGTFVTLVETPRLSIRPVALDALHASNDAPRRHRANNSIAPRECT
ncbi:hypothetical protein SPRG_17874 [Saprolegnia parasitica CBS 223.65]|uniref:Uncharacterized protein n=1 Tax=Saprolegnia parasitica (strain CBS 223.65) TaxID=695850 RepID=A0A067BPJ6_SAPPC|nr:hypothetical protein SPRG_17874 [Saprolegnia parasitica CBS 223.65]KDO16622.1 hypothetical protein SPRG_17874 [Saprolegnia parasitica CBS 223.65]|eukprot:XP_012212671.1 hypothetical protein SPRG_17874 [Saprolegnia parasitica CBS 223.65]